MIKITSFVSVKMKLSFIILGIIAFECMVVITLLIWSQNQWLTRYTSEDVNSFEVKQTRKFNEVIYIKSISEEVQDIEQITAIFQVPWRLNTSNVYQLRKDIKKSINTEMILTKTDVKPSQNLSYASQNETVTISQEFYNMLPEVSPIGREYKRCSIVGNSGILHGSKCGNEIDRADFVIRCNAPPISQFSVDAGVKSSITTINPSILISRFGGIQRLDHSLKFLQSLKQYNKYIWFPSLYSKETFRRCLRASKLINKISRKRIYIKVLNGNPNHFKDVSRYCKNNFNISKTLSSGFYITMSALLYCKEIHLYGFWPFFQDLNNRSIPYHYFENVTLNRYGHAFGKEFKELLRLHSDGILQLHVDKCSL